MCNLTVGAPSVNFSVLCKDIRKILQSFIVKKKNKINLQELTQLIILQKEENQTGNGNHIKVFFNP